MDIYKQETNLRFIYIVSVSSLSMKLNVSVVLCFSLQISELHSAVDDIVDAATTDNRVSKLAVLHLEPKTQLTVFDSRKPSYQRSIVLKSKCFMVTVLHLLSVRYVTITDTIR